MTSIPEEIPISISKEDLKRAQEYHDSLDVLYVYRLNYSMVAQSMLILSYAALLSSGRDGLKIKFATIAICCFGIFYTYIQRVLAKSLATRTSYIRKEYLMKMDNVFIGASKARIMPLKNVQTDWIPWSLATLWSVLLMIAVF